ncbi:MAG: flagellar type III secretion system pore protein FliP [Alphaproteobacteria bacterium]|nr:flagellar type III secretion system pore protein FliP [Alphaproteobacteria bacterium]
MLFVCLLSFLVAVAFAFGIPETALAQSFSFEVGEGGTVTGRLIQLVILVAVLTLAPAIVVMLTSFIRLIVAFSLLRTALGTQQTPPNQVLISLALFLTFFIMQPTLTQVYDEGIAPLIEGRITEEQALERSIGPFRSFMLNIVREKDLGLFMDIGNIKVPENAEDTPMRALIPAFVISELKRGFEIGFMLFVPFLIIDMVVASILMSMGMMMLPPILISMPFKIIFFVLVDGWYLVVGSLTRSFDTGLI